MEKIKVSDYEEILKTAAKYPDGCREGKRRKSGWTL